MRDGDTADSARDQAETFQDSRLLQGWDPGRQIAERFSRRLKLTRTAWDVYLLYAPGIRWEEEYPPPPTFWMHQLTPDSGADQRLWLDLRRFTQELHRFIARDP